MHVGKVGFLWLMIDFKQRVSAFELGMSFQERYAREIKGFVADIVERINTGQALSTEQSALLLITDPVTISEVLIPWSNSILESRIRLHNLLAEYLITDAYFAQRTWADGHSRIYGDVLDMYEFPNSPILRTPAQASYESVDAIRKAFPIDSNSDTPLGHADEEFAAQLRKRGNPWVKYAID